jgi:predicted membrane-bound mannosyltransferase
VGLLLLGGVGHLAWLSYQTSYVFNTDGRNPYAYAQTVPDLVDLGERMKELARAAPQHEAMVIKVLSVDEYYWPLPWYLRWFPNVGYWTEVPPDPAAPVVIASPQFDQELERRLGSTHQMTGYLGLRPTVVFGIWVQKDLWQTFLESRSQPRPTP